MRILTTTCAALLAIAALPARAQDEDGTTTSSAARPYTVAVGVELRMLAVSDEDPANDRALFYRGELSWKITPALRGLMRAGVTHQFVEVGTVPAVRFQDFLIGAAYKTPIELGGERVDLSARLGLYLPTSRASQRQTLYAAPDLSLAARYSPLSWLELEAGLLSQYRFVQFAERDGPGGPLNVQFVLSGTLGVGVTPYEDGESSVSLGASVSTTLRKRYASAELFESPLSTANYWDQLYGWSLYAAWTPWAWLTASVGLEQGGPVLRDGIVNVFFTKLEETELVFAIRARY